MATFPVSGAFTAVATLTGSPSGIKRRKAVGTGTTPTTISVTASLSLDTAQISYVRAITHSFSDIQSNLELNEDPQYFTIVRSQVWWNKAYTYRRILQVQPNPEGFELDHPLYIVLSKNAVRQAKIQSDGSDIEVLRLVLAVPETWEVVPKYIEDTDTEFTVTWPNQIEIPKETTVKDTYYVYYGNNNMVDVPTDTPSYTPVEWPVSVPYGNSRITYTRPGEHWEDGVGLQEGAKATLEFYGSDVRVVSDVGPSFGIAEIQVDDNDWEQIDLYGPVLLESQEVFSAHGLTIGNHTIRVRRSGFKAASATDYNINIKTIDYLRHNAVANVGEEADETLMWGSAIGGVVGK